MVNIIIDLIFINLKSIENFTHKNRKNKNIKLN